MAQELELYQIFEQMRSFQKQVDIIRRETKGYQWLVGIGVVILLISMHYMNLIDHLIPIILLTFMILVFLSIIFYRNKLSQENISMQIHSEKKAIKKVRKTLSNFDSRTISNVRASPAAFARILTNELLYQDFRFDIHAQKQSQSK